jgi:hypothetical protein
MNNFRFGLGKKNIEEKNEKDEKDKKSDNKSDEKQKKIPEMKSVTKKSEKKALSEDDGGITIEKKIISKKDSFRMLPIISRDSEELDSDDDEYIEENFSRILNEKFEDDERELNSYENKRKRIEAKSSVKEKDTKINLAVDKPLEKNNAEKREKYSVAAMNSHRGNISDSFPSLSSRTGALEQDEKNSSAMPTSPRGRPSKAPAFIRNLSQRMSLVQADDLPQQQATRTSVGMATPVLDDLLSKPWNIEADKKGNALLKNIPDDVLNKLSDLAFMISTSKDFQGRSYVEQETYMRKQIGKKFLNLIEKKIESRLENKYFDSPENIKIYLKINFGIIVGAEKSDKRKTVSSSDAGKSPRLGDEKPDFHEKLMQELAIRMRNREVDYEFGGKNTEEIDLMKKNIDQVFGAAFKSEKVEGADKANSDVASTFIRDFPNSSYYFEDARGTTKKLTSQDEFINIFNDSGNKNLAYTVSHYCNQNLPIFLKNVMFSQTAKDGSPVSVLKLYDGTPLAISTSFKSAYTIKKLENGNFLLSYKGTVDTSGAEKSGKNTATMLKKSGTTIERTAVLITNANAEVTYQIEFGSNGSVVHSYKPRLCAKGWNHISENN